MQGFAIFRGPEVLKWAKHLSRVYQLPLPSIDIQEEYQNLNNAVPECLLDNAVVANNKEDAMKVVESHLENRQGIVNAYQRSSVAGEV